ncbi:MAG: HAD family hydrolase [Candidatus Promineifilaceae bacterium]|jgi:HAD superfamily hydrolase (TIGR01549 family)
MTEGSKNGLSLVNRPLDAVFFDWDYTLAYTKTPENTPAERLAYMFKLAGLPYTQSEIETALQQYRQDVAAGKISAMNQPQKRREIARFYGYLFDYLGEEDKSWSTMERLYGTYAQLPTYLYEDARPTLSLLRDQGYKLGIVSNHSASARPVMERLVGDLVPSSNIIISEEIGVHKPARTIFRRAAACVGSQPPPCLVLIGDNLRVDAIGAVESGNFCGGIWLDRRGKGENQSLPEGVVRITSLKQLAPLLSKELPS